MLDRERVVADVAEALEADSAALAEDANLVDAGLDSIRLMSLVEKWKAEGVPASFVDLVENPTLDGWFTALGVD